MSTTYTAATKLAKPALGDTGWSAPLNANADALDALNPIGDLCVTTTEIPSAALTVKVAAGNYLKLDGTIATYAGTSSQAITTATTKVLYLDLTASGVLTVAASFPTTAHIRLATVVAGATTITSIGDERIAFTPIATQPAGAAQGAITDSTGSTATTTLVTVRSDTAAHTASDAQDNDHVLFTLVNAMRTALVAAGVMKGSA
jgi:hypothetical protein